MYRPDLLVFIIVPIHIYIRMYTYRERVSGVTYNLLEVLISDLSIIYK